MNYIDIVLAVPLLWGLYKGVSRGIVKEISSLLALILGIYGAVRFSDQLQPFISIDSDYQAVVLFSITFILIVLLVRLLGLILDKILELVSLTFLSRIFGAIFGVLKVAFVLSSILLVFNTIDNQLGVLPIQDQKKSVLYKPISSLVPMLVNDSTDSSQLIKGAKEKIEKIEKSIR